jgi:hypothetical protein
MTVISFRGPFSVDLLAPRSTPDVRRGVFQYGPYCDLDAIVRVCRLSDSVDAFLAAGKRSRRKVAIILHRVPAGLDAAHVGFIFTDVMGSGHCGTPVRSNSSTKVGLMMGEFATKD